MTKMKYPKFKNGQIYCYSWENDKVGEDRYRQKIYMIIVEPGLQLWIWEHSWGSGKFMITDIYTTNRSTRGSLLSILGDGYTFVADEREANELKSMLAQHLLEMMMARD